MLLSVLSLVFLLLPISLSQSQPLRGSLFINCGAADRSLIDGVQWVPDSYYIQTGSSKTVNQTVSLPILSSVRSFPLARGKFCYVVPVSRGWKYLVRTTYYYGGVNGDVFPSPPVFNQIIDGSLWGVVNTTDDYAKGNASYYEGVFVAAGRRMSVCVAANRNTDSDPFISALEFVLLGDSLYNSTDFRNYALRLIARNSFGYSGPIIRYPDDQFDRYWAPFGANSPTLTRGQNVSVSGFWNLPPLKIFQTQLTTAQPAPLEINWPPTPLPNSTYYVALYFSDDSTSGTRRVFNIRINDVTYCNDLNAIPSGVVVFANRWPLSGPTKITLLPAHGSTLGPSINAGELFEVVPLGNSTLAKDVIALESIKRGFHNPPLDWNGDPCLPQQYSWTGVTCSQGDRIRVISLNLTGMGLSGSLSPNIANLTALTDIWLGNNSLSGSIPDLSSLRRLQTIHLEDNDLGDEIPPSLATLNLHELFLQNNNLTGNVPSSLLQKPGYVFKPGNPFLTL